jgi:protein-S-isoprenylcysteine O-methyltransferase Ste14
LRQAGNLQEWRNHCGQAIMTTLRHLLAVLLLPFAAAVVMPYWLLTAWTGIDTRWGAVSAVVWIPRSAGAALLACGLALFGWCVGLFARVGRGTLAPWDPTQRLVAVGPYRHVRNPMISAVAMILAGQALISGSWVMGAWVLLFVVVNHVYFLLSEEPGLQQRFGESYRTYRANVPRWIPRWSPWPD